ncbi:MAG: helix-turn-helix transcriptional regulator [Dehalococcoidia bacterium]|nr:helix-turn-helix transcriptional regulator [Dehalococcoidia bacterium]
MGPLLRRLRGDLSLRDVTKRIGVSSSYLSQIERSDRKPGTNVIRKLADLYNVDADELLKRAGQDSHIDPFSDEAMEVERAYQYVLADPVFRVGTRPDGPITLKTKRFIVEMYERFANKRLLE